MDNFKWMQLEEIVSFTCNLCEEKRLSRWRYGKEHTCQYRRLEMWVQSQDWEDSLEEGMATHSSILAWVIPWTEEPGGLQSGGVAKGQTWLSEHTRKEKLLPASTTNLIGLESIKKCIRLIFINHQKIIPRRTAHVQFKRKQRGCLPQALYKNNIK